ncbi:hypothetical protein, partial [Microcoleus sp. K5-D4]|uniref:hypothetical protein n=1 Tax=Microcoleus sp. K5-D4 TaxID=2818801 RepID=UPI002FD239E8
CLSFFSTHWLNPYKGMGFRLVVTPPGKKENVLTAPDKGLTLIYADVEKRDRNNSDANRFDIRTKVLTKYKIQNLKLRGG